jgi:pyruvate,orthophosphate dikinase
LSARKKTTAKKAGRAGAQRRAAPKAKAGASAGRAGTKGAASARAKAAGKKASRGARGSSGQRSGRRGAGATQRKVFYFGGGRADGDASMKEILGGKGANLAEMTSLGIPVPPGFTISTEVCVDSTSAARSCPPRCARTC